MYKLRLRIVLSLLVTSNLALFANESSPCEPNCGSGHPLDPLSCEEISAVKKVVDALPESKGQYTIYADIILKEPKKAAVKQFEANGGKFLRQAEALLYNNQTAQTWKIVVPVCGSQTGKAQVKKLPGVFPNMNRINDFQGITPCENPIWLTTDELKNLVKENNDIIDALTKAGYKDPKALLDSGALYPYANAFESFRSKESSEKCCPETITKNNPSHRFFPITIVDNTLQTEFSADFYSIVEGIEAIVDVTKKEILYVIVTDPKRVDKLEPDTAPRYEHINCLKPLCATMPQGPSFCVDKNVVTWDNWQFRLSWHPHSGLQLYNIKYWDSTIKAEDKYRSILYKASLTDAMVSYNVGSETLFARNYLSGDGFHYPWMRRFTEICPGRDVPEYATLLNMYLADTNGNPTTFKNSVALYEQDGDLLWRTATNDPVDGARGRQLVVRTIFQGTFYLWIVSWVFNQDGSINVGVDVGGRTQNIIVSPNAKLPHGEIIAPQQFALNHTHMYNFRLDFDIDGINNSVVEENQHTINDRKKNPCGQAVQVTETVFKKEKEAIRNMNLESNRQWIVINPKVKNRLNHPVGYELIPLRNGFDKSADYSALHKQFSFIKNHLHVTKYHDKEQFASGEMPILQDHDTGLGEFVKDNEDIENKDIVVWYTLSFGHVPHTEDYPWIPLYRQGFSLTPHNFFNSNPGFTVKNPKICKGGEIVDVTCTTPPSNPLCNTCVPQPELPACPVACPAPSK